VSTKEENLLVVQNIFNASKYTAQQNKRVHVTGEDLKKSVEYGIHVVISSKLSTLWETVEDHHMFIHFHPSFDRYDCRNICH
jgi:hypothetical protein